LAESVGILLIVSLAVVLSGTLLAVNFRMAPRRDVVAPREPLPASLGVEAAPRRRFAVRFYSVAVLFLVFEAGLIFLHPWAAVLRELGASGLLAMATFVAPLAVALVYAWAKGAFRW
jgi:NADH-quinone oxidoreductase subunit A